MALEQRELLKQLTKATARRMVAHADGAIVGTFDVSAGAELLEEGTALIHAAGANWALWTQAGLEPIKGFVYFQSQPSLTVEVDKTATPWVEKRGVKLSAADEVQGVILVAGLIHRDDVPLNGELQADLDAALATGPLARGLIVQGLVGVN